MEAYYVDSDKHQLIYTSLEGCSFTLFHTLYFCIMYHDNLKPVSGCYDYSFIFTIGDEIEEVPKTVNTV